MNARKLLSILLALLLALAILPAGAAGDPFCMVGATAYDDLAAAAQAASSSGEPILITKDFDCAGQLELDGLVVTVELQGFTLNVTQASGTDAAGAGLYVRNGGALTVNGPGTLNFAGTFAGIYAGSADVGDCGAVSITGAATVTATGSHGVVSNNSLNEVQVTGAFGGSAVGDYSVYCVDGKAEVFGCLSSPSGEPRTRNGVYADNNARVHVFGNIEAAEAAVRCAAAADARIWVHGTISGWMVDFDIGAARAEGVMSVSAMYPGFKEYYRIQKYSQPDMDPGYPLGYVFESRILVKIPTTITPEPITGVTSPALGVAPSNAIDNGTSFTAQLISWSPSNAFDWSFTPPGFGAGTVYTAMIRLTAKPGFHFIGLDTDALIEGFTVNGIKPTLENNFSDVLDLAVTFPATGEFLVRPTIAAATLPGGAVGTAYSQTLSVSGNAPIAWSIISGALPAGLALNPATGAITGTPTAAGTAFFTVKAANDWGDDTQPLSIAVSAPPMITTPSLPGGVVGTAYSQTLTATGDAPFTWSITNGALPDGLTLNPATGEIAGTPTAEGAAHFNVWASNGAGGATMPLSIEVSMSPVPPAITTDSLPAGTVGEPFSQFLAVTGTAPITWSLAGGALPAGLMLTPTGEITGTPTAAGTASFTVKATNGAGDATKPLSILVNVKPGPGPEPLKYIKLWGKVTRYKDTFWNQLLCVLFFGWIWMWF